MKDIKDYLHLYLGCECIVYDSKLPVKLIGVQLEAAIVTSSTYQSDYGTPFLITIDIPGLVKPILRPLSDMTEEEKETGETIYMKMQEMADEEGHICDAEIWAEVTRWQLSQGFDVFQLIEAGLAIDKTTLKQTA